MCRHGDMVSALGKSGFHGPGVDRLCHHRSIPDPVKGQPESLRYGSFRKLGVPYFGVPIIRILLFRANLGYYIRASYSRKLPYQSSGALMISVNSGPAKPIRCRKAPTVGLEVRRLLMVFTVQDFGSLGLGLRVVRSRIHYPTQQHETLNPTPKKALASTLILVRCLSRDVHMAEGCLKGRRTFKVRVVEKLRSRLHGE